MVRSIRRNFRICSRCTVETFDLSVCLRVCMCACEREREREREIPKRERESASTEVREVFVWWSVVDL